MEFACFKGGSPVNGVWETETVTKMLENCMNGGDKFSSDKKAFPVEYRNYLKMFAVVVPL